MDPEVMKARTKAFLPRVVRLTESLPANRTADVIGRQLLRAGTSVGANYRAVRRAKSRKDFLNKLAIVEEETDESAFWIELLVDAGVMKRSRLDGLLKECNEILAIIVATIQSTKKKKDA